MNFKNFFLGENKPQPRVYAKACFTKNSCDRLYKWILKQDLGQNVEITPIKDYHCTILYSRKFIPKNAWINQNVSFTCLLKSFKIFPYDKNSTCLTIELNAQELKLLHNYFIAFGATHDYPEYIPHITVANGISKDFDLNKLLLPNIKLNVEEIKTKEPDLNWASKK